MTTEHINKYFTSQPHFRLENPHPAWANKRGWRWDREDCVIRSFANALSISWLEAYDYLAAKGRRDLYCPNDSGAFRKWIPEGGGKWIATPAKKGQKRMTALGFAEAHPKGRYILYISHHFTACVDGVILDAWNCGDGALVGYFDLTDFRMV